MRLVFRHFPLSQSHPRAMEAAIASLAAGEQDKFWEFHDALFGAPRRLSQEGSAFLRQTAKRLELDMVRFEVDCDHPRLRRLVQEDQRLLTDLGQAVVPTLFVNGRMIKGAVPLDRLEAIVDEERQRARDALARGVAREALYTTLSRGEG